MKETTIRFIAQSPTPSSPPSPAQAQQPFDPGTATIWAALITAGLSSVATIISLVSNRRLMTPLERERREHDIKLANMHREHEIQLENARLRPERRLQFIGYWRKQLRKDAFTHEDICNDKAYKTLEGFISPEALHLIRQELQKTEEAKKSLSDRLNFEETAFHASNMDWDDDVYARGEHLAYENYYDAYYANLSTPEEYDEVLRSFKRKRKQLEKFDSDMTKYIKDLLEEELRRLEKEEWELL